MRNYCCFGDAICMVSCISACPRRYLHYFVYFCVSTTLFAWFRACLRFGEAIYMVSCISALPRRYLQQSTAKQRTAKRSTAKQRFHDFVHLSSSATLFAWYRAFLRFCDAICTISHMSAFLWCYWISCISALRRRYLQDVAHVCASVALFLWFRTFRDIRTLFYRISHNSNFGDAICMVSHSSMHSDAICTVSHISAFLWRYLQDFAHF